MNRDCYHLGHMVFDSLSRYPESICQIDAATGEEETYASVLSRSIRLARCMRKLGLQPGDVLAIGGKNHLDLHIAFYAGMLNGYPIAGVDPLFKYDEIKNLLRICEAKIVFCQYENYKDFARAVADLELKTRIVTFGGDDHRLDRFMDEYDDKAPQESFKVAEFDTDKIFAWLISTSGTTGMPKLAAFKHSPWIDRVCRYLFMKSPDDVIDNKGRKTLKLSPIQWLSAYFLILASPLTHDCMIQTSAPATTEHVIDIINKYRPQYFLSSPSTISSILKHETPCDITCIEILNMTGSKITTEVLLELKKRLSKTAMVLESYGQTETFGPALVPVPDGPLGSCGKAGPGHPVKLVDPVTGEEITEPNTPGELYVKGLCFTEYYRNPVETAKTFTEDGWYKTGDLLYFDENKYFFFVERMKMLIKYKNYHIMPTELEEVIQSHPGVMDAAVTGLTHECDGQVPVACVVRRPNSTVTAQEIKDLVASKLSEIKCLRGGIVFLDELPYTSTGKVARTALHDIVKNSVKE